MKLVSVLPLNVRGVADKLLSGGQSCATKSPRIAQKFTLEFRSNSSTCNRVQFGQVIIRFSPVFWSICLTTEFSRVWTD
jgi:hypothetical protein